MTTTTDTINPERATQAAALRASAIQHETARNESFDRCDTDGFLSQWAHQLCAERDRLQVQVVEQGGLWDFPALFDLAGNLVAAKLIPVTSRFTRRPELMWGLLTNDDPHSPVTGWIKAHPARTSTLERKGYREGTVRVTAKAVIAGKDTAYATIIRLDHGFCRDACITNNGKETAL